MSLYAIIRSDAAVNNAALASAIAKKYPNDFYRLGRGQWLVSASIGIEQLSASLRVEKGRHFGGTLIVEIADYFGLHDKKVWEWVKGKYARPSIDEE